MYKSVTAVTTAMTRAGDTGGGGCKGGKCPGIRDSEGPGVKILYFPNFFISVIELIILLYTLFYACYFQFSV